MTHLLKAVLASLEFQNAIRADEYRGEDQRLRLQATKAINEALTKEGINVTELRLKLIRGEKINYERLDKDRT